MSNFLANVRIPGVIWALLLIIVIAFLHENEASLPFDAFYADMIVVLLIGVLKSLSLGTEQLEQALDIIEAIRQRNAANRERGAAAVPGDVATAVMVDTAPERPNKLVRFLLG